MLCLQLLSHREGHRALVECLVSGDGHHDFVTDTEEKQTTLWQVQRHLTNDLIKALGEELLTDWADATLPSLTLHKLLVKHFTQSRDIDSRGGLMAHILDPVLA